MFNLILGFVIGVVLAGLGIVTLPKLKALFTTLKGKFFAKDALVTVTTPTDDTTKTVAK